MENHNYLVTIGVEIHLELNTKSKMFSNSPNLRGEANKFFNLFDLGYLGTLPKINKSAVKKAILLAKALKMEISPVLAFDRKNYFYPDLPKGYQITQQFYPIGKNGTIKVGDFFVEIERIHLEEDTAKQIHIENSTFFDYNRCGVPLIEIVTKPVLSSAKQASQYVEEIRKLALFLGISDAKMENGSLRADINISVREKNQSEFNPKVEIKNINSISNIQKSAEIEIKEQIKTYENNEKVEQVTKKFNDKLIKNQVLRVKTDSIDYKYFPEPNLPYIELEKDFVDEIILPLTPTEIFELLKSKGVTDFYANQILNNVDFWNFLKNSNPTNWVESVKLFFAEIVPIINKVGMQNLNIDFSFFSNLVSKKIKNEISNTDFREVIKLKQENSKLFFDEIVEKISKSKISDNELNQIFNQILLSESEQIEKNKQNKEKLVKFLIGKLVQTTKGSADPKQISKFVIDWLEKL
ncbi:Asp-tRNA(Asn)/Glu-tRNA(Gln) amidotransferase subunit GatB [Mycoplasma sp. 'Moose RK']|uniref:Asp-tRNA(Asn)/Glu-tRNA(Gln) amidotransferase subunit GatB n=1 Tax=Mycoplasma sp. 'Moose RK' TaxID=2780095 RepID=UPI0018C2B987|nr:Asp-tRNA(Asn)/Glu-tRNA(Gln) amidotransferase subunit GatB [Mycoplasma sp. 'Moose RK']MBG0730502.1 Asp-tRNA(Asn)/Glu-tRNA(Gln) amidotransferase subunit GatB [Mycoplasma sp. 'Moose RK']